ncbi:MBL fold metallo-hydrolase, partial [Nonomuraea rhizosphaerae]|uniref:MBL fold metallo-hydrolase n=1 Tax=Nonomuraea rhizosphaerae TaxID=2665663 RepID=UPI001C5F4F48
MSTPDEYAEKASVRFIGNATTLIRCNGFTILTDPNFLHRGQRAYLGYGLSSKRLTEPAMTVEELPPLDAIVLSHMHGDHWDREAQRKLDKGTPIITTGHAAGKRVTVSVVLVTSFSMPTMVPLVRA